MEIRPATPQDHAAIWSILEPVIRSGETYALDPSMPEDAALAYWCAADKETFVCTDAAGLMLGTYFLRANQQGGGAHVANCGYVSSPDATARGVARAMCAHSLDHARARGYRAMQFNFVVSSNVRAVRLWESFGFAQVGRLPEAFHHPLLGYVDALVMFRTV